MYCPRAQRTPPTFPGGCDPVISYTVSPCPSYIEALPNPQFGSMWRWAFKVVTKVKWGHKCGDPIPYDRCPYKKKKRQGVHTEKAM